MLLIQCLRVKAPFCDCCHRKESWIGAKYRNNKRPAKPGGNSGDHAMPRIIGPTILAIGIVCAPVIFASMPGDAAHSQVPSMQLPLVQAPSIKGDRLNAKPVRTEVPVRAIGPTRVV